MRSLISNSKRIGISSTHENRKLSKKNNERENAKRIRHTYSVGDKVLYAIDTKSKYGEDPWKGPFKIRKVYDNGTVRLQMGAVTDTVNIRLLKPYRE